MNSIKLKNIFYQILSNRERNILIISQIFNALLGIVLGKLIAVYFLPEQFGSFNLQFATYTFFFSLFLNPFLQFMKTFSMNDLQLYGYSQVFKVLIILFVVCEIILFLIFRLYYKGSGYLFLVIFLTLLVNILFNLYTDYFNIKGFLSLFSWSNISKSVASLILLYVFYNFLNDFIEPIVLLWLVQLVGFFFGIIFFTKHYRWIFSDTSKETFNKFWQKYVKFCWPLLILAFWAWVNSYFDRYVIEYYLQTKDVGVYNANLSLGSKVFLMINPLFLALITPFVFNGSYEKKEKKKIIVKYAVVYTLFSLFLLIFLFFTTDYLGKILLSKLYCEGFYIIFWSALGYFFITLAYIFETIFYAESKTKTILISNVISAIFFITLNFILIPVLGLPGALIGLLGGALARLFYICFIFFKF